jgi:hypothetical protein
LFCHDHVRIDANPAPPLLALPSNVTVTVPPCATPRFSALPLLAVCSSPLIVKLAEGEARMVISTEADCEPSR